MALIQITFEASKPLFNTAATRQIEQAAARALLPHTLMQRAGLAVAQLACALAPDARVIWLACGPGNNGGDGLAAAMHLKMWGREPIVTWLGSEHSCPADSRASYERARAVDVSFADSPPLHWDLAVDALLGIGIRPAEEGASRAPAGLMKVWLAQMMGSGKPVLHVDVPSGFDINTGTWLASAAPQDTINSVAPSAYSMPARGQFPLKNTTLSLLTLKPGLFTAQGRDACGDVWFDDLGTEQAGTEQALQEPNAWLLGAQDMRIPPRVHASHKGSYGDVAVIGGAGGMQGAALLAARAALHAGAGRVFVALLGGGMVVDPQQPELMFRDLAGLDLKQSTVVCGCGCGGGEAVRKVLPRVISTAARLVLDADALNAIAVDTSLQTLLQARAKKNKPTLLTPHPLEAARLLGCSTAQVQADRLQAAQNLADKFACTVILKGSGSIIAIAGPGAVPAINPTGDARLATAGAGDVLAGICGALLAQQVDANTPLAAQQACWWHGSLVSGGSDSNACAFSRVTTASALIQNML